MADVRILLISGSTRRGSGNTAALRTVQALAPDGIAAELYDGLSALPAFSPDEDEHPPGPAADLRARIAAAGALLFCTVPVPREAVGPDGLITDPEIRTGLGAALAALAEHARG